MPPPSYLPLRWESTGDQWWYASPIDWAAANGHFDLVRELLRLDCNHLITLTSLRRIRRLETVWDDDEHFHDVASCRSKVARKLFVECETKRGKNTLIRAGYGGWLLYTAASAGDLGFVQDLLERDPLLVFGEGEYGVTDLLYAAAKSKNSEVFRVIFDFAVSPRFLSGKGGEVEEQIGEIPSGYRWEMINRAVHAAARGGNLKVLKELLHDDYSDVLSYRDVHGSTILHAAAARGQVQVVKDIIASCDIISSMDNQGNTALHVAAYRGQSAVVEALILASPSSISLTNKYGDTFLHMAVSGFQTPGFRRLDRQIELVNHLVSGKIVNIDNVINVKNIQGRTALHAAILGNIDANLVELLMTVRCINVNIQDVNGMTPVDLLKQRPRSASSEILIKQLISAGGIFSSQDHTARKAIVSHINNMKGNIGSSPGTSFRIPDSEIFLYTGITNPFNGPGLSYLTEPSQLGSSNENHSPGVNSSRKPGSGSVAYAAQRLKMLFNWPRIKEKTPEKLKKLSTADNRTPTPLRERFSQQTALPNNKRTLSVRSNLPSPTNRKKLASGIVHGVMQSVPHSSAQHRSPSDSFSKSSSFSSHNSFDKQKGSLVIENDSGGPSCSNNEVYDDITPSLRMNKRKYFCCGAPGSSTRPQYNNQTFKRSVLSAA